MTSTDSRDQTPEESSQSWRNVAARVVASPLLRWNTGMPAMENIVAVPPGLRSGSVECAREIYAGHFEFNGQSYVYAGKSPFGEDSPSTAWERELHGFFWLRHLAKAATPLAQANAKIMVDDWILSQAGNRNGPAWDVDVVANRIIAWLTYSPLTMAGATRQFASNFIHSITEQVTWLDFSTRSMPVGMSVLKARIAVALSSLCLATHVRTSRKKYIEHVASFLGQELERQFFADGMHVSRNPDNCTEALLDLLPLHQVYLQQAFQPPPQLISTIDRVVPMVRFFRHRDGATGQFNGAGITNQSLVNAVISAGNSSGKAPENASVSGYQRLQSGQTTILVDTGKPGSSHLSRQAHAGCLAFEMSSRASRFIINCGRPCLSDLRYLKHARSTAAHSTVVLNDTSSNRFQGTSRTPSLGGIRKVSVQRDKDSNGEWISAAHDGYLDLFGLCHERSIFLGDAGNAIYGKDRFYFGNEANRTNSEANIATVRFHVHPDIDVKLLDNKISVLLTAEDGNVWKFTCIDAAISIDDSIHFSHRNSSTLQIVLTTPVGHLSEIRWVFEQYAPSAPENQDGISREVRQPGDLLDEILRNNDHSDPE